MTYFDIILVLVTIFIDTEFSVTDHNAKNLLTFIVIL